MSEESVPGLPGDWRPPEMAQREKAWERLDDATRERFTDLQRQGWKEQADSTTSNANPRTQDGSNTSSSLPTRVRVNRSASVAVKLELDEYKRVNAIIDEHFPYEF
jgi:hypothetical protein